MFQAEHWERTERVLTRTGLGLLGLFVILYTAVILAFGAWQSDPLPVAWVRNLPEVITGTWFAVPFWGGILALAVGWGLRFWKVRQARN